MAGDLVSVTLGTTTKGYQAVERLSVESADGRPDVDTRPEPDPEAELLPARLKWFDKGKGFGFANVFGSDEDVFIHIEVLRNSGLADLQPGEAICIRVLDGNRGLMAAAIHSWESVLLP